MKIYMNSFDLKRNILKLVALKCIDISTIYISFIKLLKYTKGNFNILKSFNNVLK
jgi:hypothetical protein